MICDAYHDDSSKSELDMARTKSSQLRNGSGAGGSGDPGAGSSGDPSAGGSSGAAGGSKVRFI